MARNRKKELDELIDELSEEENGTSDNLMVAVGSEIGGEAKELGIDTSSSSPQGENGLPGEKRMEGQT